MNRLPRRRSGPAKRLDGCCVTTVPLGISPYDETIMPKSIREGKVQGVRELNHIMPWKHLRHMGGVMT